MSPLFLVGILSLSIPLSHADVKHVLEGSAHPPSDSNYINPEARDINYLAHSGSSASSFASSSSFSSASSGAFAGAAPFSSSGAKSGAFSGAPSGSAAFSGAPAAAGAYAGASAGASVGANANFQPENQGFAVKNSGFASGNANGAGGNFWWANNNSPFKDAYDQFKRCSLKGNCSPQVAGNFAPASQGNAIASAPIFPASGLPTFDIKKNPFLNGNFQGVAISSCSGSACKDGKPQTVITTCKGEECKTSTVDAQGSVGNNPFLNGGSNSFVASGGTGSFSGGNNFDVNKNPFLSGSGSGAFAGSSAAAGGTVTSGNGAQIPVSNEKGFLGVQPAQPFSKKPFSTNYPSQQQQSLNQGAQPFPTSYPSQSSSYSKKPFGTSYPAGQGSFASSGAFAGANAGAGSQYFKPQYDNVNQAERGLSCKGAGYICVSKDACLNGVVRSGAEGVYQAANKVGVFFFTGLGH